MKIYVIDTSALIRFYIPDGPCPILLEESIDSAFKAETTLIMPELALAEAGQVLLKKEKSEYLTQAEVDEIITAILELPIEIVGHHDYLEDAISLARLHNLTVYDSLFLAVAIRKGGELISVDERLKKAFKAILSKTD